LLLADDDAAILFRFAYFSVPLADCRERQLRVILRSEAAVAKSPARMVRDAPSALLTMRG
jgi:hypothetical protein